jgi:hypothetical protein
MQETCIRHMGKKMLVALMMEGKFSGEGLQSLDANEDLLTAMARELVEKGGVGESADAVWKNLERERAKHERAASTEVESPVAAAEAPEELDLTSPSPQPTGLHLVHSTAQAPNRKETPIWPTARIAGEQMSLFG